MPNVGIERPDEPHATSSRSGSRWRMARAVSAARRPYSAAVLWPSCHGPSISLPRHHIRMPCGSVTPCSTRRSDSAVPCGWLAYSRRSSASCRPRVPEVHRHDRLDVGLAAHVHELVQAERVALDGAPGGVEPGRPVLRPGRPRPPTGTPRRSCRPGSAPRSRRAHAPAPGRRRAARRRRTSGGPARRCPPYTHRPMCSTNDPKTRRLTGATTKAGSIDSVPLCIATPGVWWNSRAGSGRPTAVTCWCDPGRRRTPAPGIRDLLADLVLQVLLRLVERLLGRHAVLEDLRPGDRGEDVVDLGQVRVGEGVEVADVRP